MYRMSWRPSGTCKAWILNCNHYANYSLKCYTSFIIRSLTVAYGKPPHPRVPSFTSSRLRYQFDSTSLNKKDKINNQKREITRVASQWPQIKKYSTSSQYFMGYQQDKKSTKIPIIDLGNRCLHITIYVSKVQLQWNFASLYKVL
jgi:hypothetical protein